MQISLSQFVNQIIRNYLTIPLIAISILSGSVLILLVTWLDHSENLKMINGNKELLTQLILAGDSVSLSRQLRAMVAIGDWESGQIYHRNGLSLASFGNEKSKCANRIDIQIQNLSEGYLCYQRGFFARTSNVLMFLGVFFISIAITLFLSVKRTLRSLGETSNRFEKIAQAIGAKTLIINEASQIKEERDLVSNFNELLNKEQQYHQILLKNERESVLSNVAKQVSHDIRSPLSALNMIIAQLQNIPEQQRLILRNSVNRINDIANILLNKSKEQTASSSTGAAQAQTPVALSVELLSALVDTLVSEKRVQFRDKIGIDIEAALSDSYGAFVNVNATELSRLLSNTINNAIEAFSNSKGRIVVSINKTDKMVLLKVSDNGKGIPKHILEKLGQMGVTHGKEGTQSGSGLGVYHAKMTIEKTFGGKYEIQTEEGNGTSIIISLPEAPTPKWFIEKLSLIQNSQVVSIDDDLSIHSVWKARFQSAKISEHSIEHLTFTSGEEFKEFFKQEGTLGRLYLVDFELLNQKQTGLEIIDELGIGLQSILVTSRYEEKQIKEKCERLGVRLIPKGMAGFVPIEIKQPKKMHHTVLIDDDVTIIWAIWKMAANAKGKALSTYENPDEFFKAADEFDLSTLVYIDSNLGNGIRGEDVAKQIFEMGFKEIYLCTGYDASEFPQMPWIKGVVGKDAPWG